MTISPTTASVENKTEYIKLTVSIANKIRIYQIRYSWMVLRNLQAQTTINWFNHLKINQPVQMAAVNYVLSPFEGNINTGDPMGIKLDLQVTKEIDKNQ